MAISKVTLNGETLMDVTGNTSGTDNMLYGTRGTAANGTSVTGTIVATPVDDTLSTSSHNAIENAAVATALAGKADSSAIPDSTSDLTNDSNFVSDSSYVHTDNNFTTTLKNKLDGIAEGATVDDHKWNNVTLTKSTGTTSNNIYVPYMTSTSGTGANLATASTTPTAHYIAKYDANKRLSSTTPTAGDDSTLVATTAFVQSTISSLGSVLNYKGTKSTISNLPATGNITGDVWIVTADSSEHVWNGSSWEQLGTTVDLSGYALASSIPDSTSDLTNDSGFLTSSDLPSWSQASTKPSYTASEVGAATSSHVHGNITNGGDITGNVAIASGDRLVINDESASKINNSSITFGSSTSTFLANNGTWQTPSGVVTSVNGSTGAVTVSVPAASTTTPSMDGTGSYGSGTDYARANHVHPSDTTKVSKSGDTMTGDLTFNSTKGITFIVSQYQSTLSFNGAGTLDDVPFITGGFSNPVRISGIKDPIQSDNIANKNYVDSSYVIAGQLTGTTLGNKSTAEGRNVTSSGLVSHAEGDVTVASGNFSHAEGDTTTASGYASHAENYHTTASESHSHAEGYFTTASGDSSHAEGQYVTASGTGSHAEGYNTNATHASQHVFGRYNISDPSEATSTNYGTYIEIVGNGRTSNSRSNARTLDWDGNEVLAGKLTVGADPTGDMDVATKKYVSNATVRPNLLTNWYFLGTGSGQGVFPINTGGLTTYNGSTDAYGIDAWIMRNSVNTTFTSTGLQLSFPSDTSTLKGLNQTFTNISDFLGKTVTVSILVVSKSGFTDATTYPRFGLYAANSPELHSFGLLSDMITGPGLFTVTGTLPNSINYTNINFTACYANSYSGTVKIAAVKFELGDTQTLAHLEGSTWVLNEIPDYETELMRCLTYKNLPSATRLNKTLETTDRFITMNSDYVTLSSQTWTTWSGGNAYGILIPITDKPTGYRPVSATLCSFANWPSGAHFDAFLHSDDNLYVISTIAQANIGNCKLQYRVIFEKTSS